MTILEELDEIIELHDAYAYVRYSKHNQLGLINQFHEWHGKAATLFSRYLSESDQDLLKFKNISRGNGYSLASQFNEIETAFCILVDKLRNSVPARLEQYIAEGEEIAATIKYENDSYVVLKTYDEYIIGKGNDYQIWKNKCIRLLDLYFKEDGSSELFKKAVDDFATHHNAPKYMQNMIGVLKACVEIPSVLEEKSSNLLSTPSPVTINVTQNQTQSQNIALDIFIEAIKDEIPGKSFKELIAIADEEKDSSKAKSKILDKIKSFGEDVLANVLANIITNPSIWGGL